MEYFHFPKMIKLSLYYSSLATLLLLVLLSIGCASRRVDPICRYSQAPSLTLTYESVSDSQRSTYCVEKRVGAVDNPEISGINFATLLNLNASPDKKKMPYTGNMPLFTEDSVVFTVYSAYGKIFKFEVLDLKMVPGDTIYRTKEPSVSIVLQERTTCFNDFFCYKFDLFRGEDSDVSLTYLHEVGFLKIVDYRKEGIHEWELKKINGKSVSKYLKKRRDSGSLLFDIPSPSQTDLSN